MTILRGMGDAAERILAGRYIAGPTIGDAIKRCRWFNKNGIRCIINYLGEDLASEKDVLQSIAVYKHAIDVISKERLDAEISIKPSEVGLLVSDADGTMHYSELVDYAAKKRVNVWLDMEESEHVSKTIALFLTKIKSRNTGICIQSYLKRSRRDIMRLARYGANIRLVKGAYSGSGRYAFQTRAETTANYYRLMDIMFRKCRRFTIATHDTRIIEKALKMNGKHKKNVTYAMLMGIKRDYLLQLAKSNDCSVYVPFGRSWVRFAYRRLKEASNMRLIISSLFE